MKIERIDVENFQGIESFSATLTAPVTLICGPNKVGKSTIRDAIELALTGTPRRVDQKKDYGKLVRDGATGGSVRVKLVGPGLAAFSLPKGGWTENVLHGRDPAQVAVALDGQRFAALKPEERRRFLFAVTGVSTDAKAVRERMLAMGLDAKRVDDVAHMLHAGFDAAENEARGMAKAAKANWRVTTGETWGSQKAEVWTAPTAYYDADEYTKVEADLANAREELGDAQQAVGAWNGKRQAYEEAVGRRNALKTRADALKVARENVERAAKEVEAERAHVEKLREQAKGATAPGHPCPHCGGLLRVANGVAIAADAPNPEATQAAGNLGEHEAALKMLQSAHGHRQTALAAAEAATAELAALVLPDAPGDTPPGVDGIRARIRELESTRERLQQARTVADGAKAKTEQAAKHHADVVAWAKIGDALAPDGLPAKLLSEAVGPIRDYARTAAKLAKWAIPTIEDDMVVRADGREYPLLSESEQWRVDACLAAAFAAQIPTGLLLLDRFDVLDIPSRGQAVAMLRAVQKSFGLDTVIVFGTLKQPPSALPEGMASVWLEPAKPALQAAA